MPVTKRRIGDIIEERAETLKARGALVEEMRSILDGAERERRDLNARERDDYDAKEREVDGLSETIKRCNREAGEEQRNGPPAFVADQGGSMQTRARRGSITTDAQRRALSAIEQPHLDLPTEAGERLVGVIEGDRRGVESEYIAAISTPEYRRAFLRTLFARDGARSILPEDEAQAMERVAAAMEERGLVAGVADEGGYAVPIDLDPTIILTSDGSTNPLRQLARVTTTTLTEWQGVTSEGVTATFAKELAEVGDDAPTLDGPKIKPEKAHAFIPFSVEVGDDWDGIGAEISRLLADARDNLEAEKFLFGDGADEPKGLLNGIDAGSVLSTKTKEAFDADDVYALQEALPARFQPRARWLSSLTVANTTHRFSSPGGDEPPLFNEDRTLLLGKPWAEVSGMSTATSTGNADLLAYGDLETAFRIVDRIGMRIELVPHLFGPNGRPKGQRGVYAYWRVGSKTLVPNAVRVLRVKAA